MKVKDGIDSRMMWINRMGKNGGAQASSKKIRKIFTKGLKNIRGDLDNV